MRRVFITGVRGFVGGALARTLETKGWAVSGSSSEPAAGLTTIALGEAFDASCFDGAEAVVHCAYRLGQGTFETNVEGTRAIAEAAAKRGVTSQIFISSFSAHPDAVSEYGRSKLELERFFHSIGQPSVRPGLVIGNGGLYAKLSSAVSRMPVVAVPAAATPIIGVDELTTAIAIILDRQLSGTHRLFHHERVAIADVVRNIAAVRGKRRMILPVPIVPSLLVAEALAVVSARFGGVAESLSGLRMSQSFPMESDLRKFAAPSTLRGLVEAAEVHSAPLEKSC